MGDHHSNHVIRHIDRFVNSQIAHDATQHIRIHAFQLVRRVEELDHIPYSRASRLSQVRLNTSRTIMAAIAVVCGGTNEMRGLREASIFTHSQADGDLHGRFDGSTADFAVPLRSMAIPDREQGSFDLNRQKQRSTRLMCLVSRFPPVL